jgi:hypothetical protein
MKPAKEAVGWCTPRDLQKFARLASRVILNRTIPTGHGVARRPAALPGPHLFINPRIR